MVIPAIPLRSLYKEVGDSEETRYFERLTVRTNLIIESVNSPRSVTTTLLYEYSLYIGIRQGGMWGNGHLRPS